MKLTAPKIADQYFDETAYAVKHAYAGLAACWSHAEEAHKYMPAPIQENGMLVYLPPKIPEERAQLERSLASYERYFELKISEAIFAGLILQTAYMAIRLFSTNKKIPASCASFVKPKHRSVLPFCIGKELHDVPLGLIIYAGRNQYAHWDDEEPHLVNAAVFATLDRAFSDHPFADLAFDLGNPTINIYASEILLTALGWGTYETYLTEMKQLFSTTK